SADKSDSATIAILSRSLGGDQKNSRTAPTADRSLSTDVDLDEQVNEDEKRHAAGRQLPESPRRDLHRQSQAPAIRIEEINVGHSQTEIQRLDVRPRQTEHRDGKPAQNRRQIRM